MPNRRLSSALSGWAVQWLALALLFCGFCSAPAGAQPAPAKTIALPDVSHGVDLRVAYADNPRFAPLSDAQLGAILAQAAGVAKQHFGVEVRFGKPSHLTVSELFSAMSERGAAKAEKARLDPTGLAATQQTLALGLLKDMRTDGDIPAQKRFALPHLIKPPADNSTLAFAREVVATQHKLLQNWRDTPALDGQPLLGRDRFNEYTYWHELGDSAMPYDVVITNQLIASAEWEDNSVHSAVRGGVSNGITTQSHGGRFRLYSVLSSFPFLDAGVQTRQLRGGDLPSPEEANRYMGLLLAHELGHLLLHLGHPFNNPHCVMTPPERLEFRQWAQGLDAVKCPLSSHRSNTPGAIKFTRPELLFK